MKKRTVKKYSAEYKSSAVQLALRSTTVQLAAKELGLPPPTLQTWITKFKDGEINDLKKQILALEEKLKWSIQTASQVSSAATNNNKEN